MNIENACIYFTHESTYSIHYTISIVYFSHIQIDSSLIELKWSSPFKRIDTKPFDSLLHRMVYFSRFSLKLSYFVRVLFCLLSMYIKCPRASLLRETNKHIYHFICILNGCVTTFWMNFNYLCTDASVRKTKTINKIEWQWQRASERTITTIKKPTI